MKKPPKMSMSILYASMKTVCNSVSIPQKYKDQAQCKHQVSTSMSAMTGCNICGLKRCCVVHKVCTKCNEVRHGIH